MRCFVCKKTVNEEEVIYARPDGTLSTMEGKPYCQGCCPEQPKY